MKHFFLDNTLAENEWLQMNLLLTIVMVKEIPASLKWIFNNEQYPRLGKLHVFRMILRVNAAAYKRGFSLLKLIKTDLPKRDKSRYGLRNKSRYS